jgi:hypothetical protein
MKTKETSTPGLFPKVWVINTYSTYTLREPMHTCISHLLGQQALLFCLITSGKSSRWSLNLASVSPHLGCSIVTPQPTHTRMLDNDPLRSPLLGPFDSDHSAPLGCSVVTLGQSTPRPTHTRMLDDDPLRIPLLHSLLFALCWLGFCRGNDEPSESEA